MGYNAFQSICTSKSADIIRENVITGDFHISKPKNYQFLNFSGIFPRQVQIGDPIFSSDVLNIVSPVSGFANISTEKEDTIVISMNGLYLPESNHIEENFNLKTLKEKILKYGNSSLDFQNKTLIDCLNEFSGKDNTYLIFSPFMKDNCIDFQTKIQNEMLGEFELFKKNISEIFPRSRIYDLISTKKIKYHYPFCTPQYFLNKFIGMKKSENFPYENVLFFGSETLYYLLKSLYFKLPFYERLISINILGNNGKLTSMNKPINLRNGQNLKFISENFPKKKNFLSFNSFYDTPKYFKTEEENFLNLYHEYSINYFSKEPFSKKEFLCIDCMDCSYFCPLNLGPRLLLDENGKDFQSKFCLDCGICSVFCPSKIDLRKKITDLKKVQNVVA